MTFVASLGQAQSIDGREAGARAARHALEQVGRNPVALALVVACQTYALPQVVEGVASILGDKPVLGFSAGGELGPAGRQRRTVMVGLLAGDGLQARADWWPGFNEDSRACVQRMLQTMQPGSEGDGTLLLACDGLTGEVSPLLSSLGGTFGLAGCLAGGSLQRGRTFQAGGRQAGSGGLAAAWLSPKIAVGVGLGHGWQPAGPVARLTKVQGRWVRTLDDQRASEVYAGLFGYTAREWAYAPLNEMVHLYPLGLPQENSLLVRSPLRMEADGSLRMVAGLPEGRMAYVLVGNIDACLEAAREATRQALSALDGARPRLAWVLVDQAWRVLLEGHGQDEVQALRDVLGPDLPIMGGYVLGQIARLEKTQSPELFNQHIEVVIFGEAPEAGDVRG